MSSPYANMAAAWRNPLPTAIIRAAERIKHVNAVKHLRNMALFEMRRLSVTADPSALIEATKVFHTLMIRLNDDIKQPWLTHEVARKGFGGGIRRAEQEA